MSVELILPAKLPAEAVEFIQSRNGDPDKMVQTFFKIKNKQGHLVRFSYNRAQRLHSERSSDFDRVLKARKMGISSRRIARDLWTISTRKHQHRIALTHGGDAAGKLIAERIQPFIDNCDFPLGLEVRGDFILSTRTKSRYYIGTAGAKKFGRGDDITGRHFMETAHWEKPDVIGGVNEALTDNADGLDETTANGHNFWRKLWLDAKKGQGSSKAIFLPWYVEEGYVRDPALEPGPLTEEEQAILQAFDLSAANIAWRRWKIRTMDDPSLFPQEYPETDEQAFLSTGRPIFDPVALYKHKPRTCDAKFRGYLMQKNDRIVFEPASSGPLRVWKMPEQDHVYSLGADIAEGIQGGAYSTGEVIDLGDSEQVAEWHGHISPELFAEPLDLLARFYNQCTIIPESWPGPGGVTTAFLIQRQARVWIDPESDEPGFATHATKGNVSGSKPKMILDLNQALRDMHLTIRSPELLEELHAYIYDEKMRMVPSSGNYSDRLIAIALAWHCSRDMAARVDYYKPKRPEFLKPNLSVGPGVSVPKWQGPRLGVRQGMKDSI